MKVLETKQDLENLIKNKIEESSELEYKSCGALDKSDKVKFDIAKDVSAMANAAGGLIVYGIKESNHVPSKITEIDRNKFSKEWLEHVINSNISPKIEGLKIISVSVNDEDGVVYVVDVPQGNTAHQNSMDSRYYKRYNFEAVPMKDYEIRDVMNRGKYPLIELQFEIEEIVRDEQTDQIRNGITRPIVTKKEVSILKIKPYNKGSNYAQFVNYYVELPKDILEISKANRLKKLSPDTVEFYGENTFMDVLKIAPNLFGYEVKEYGPSRFDPILPKVYGRSEKIELTQKPELDNREIKWRVHADNALPQEGIISLNKILIISKK